MPKNKPLIKVNYGIASVYDSHIEINRKIKGSLKKRILSHEYRHTSGRYTLKDWQNDFQAKKPYFWESFKLACKNPEMLINYFLFMYSYYTKTWTYNSSAAYPFVYFGCIWNIFWVLLFNVNIFQALLGWVVIYNIIEIILLTYTHFYVKRTSHNKAYQNF